MSILSGLAGLSGFPGRVGLEDSGTPVVYFRGLPITAALEVACQNEPVGDFYKDGFLWDFATSSICYSSFGAIHHYISGIPCTEAGAICIESDVAVSFVQGVGIAANGRMAYV
jgi:hypothetical protein